jgi:transcriptional regulator with XRE-family HTH domain
MAYDKARVGLRVKSLRIDRGYDQKKLSDLSTVPVASIQSYEDGTSVMGMENAVKLADALGCSLDRLACRTD